MPQRGSSCGLGTAIAGAPASGCGGGDDFDALRFLAAEQGDELEEVARRVAGLSLGRVEVLSRQLEEARLQNADLERELYEASCSARHLSVYVAQCRQEADHSHSARVAAEGDLQLQLRARRAAEESAQRHLEKAQHAEQLSRAMQLKLKGVEERLNQETQMARAENDRLKLQNENQKQRLEAAKADADRWRASAERMQTQTDQMRKALGRAEDQLRLVSAELKEANSRASRQMQEQKGLASDLQRKADQAIADRDSAIKAAEEAGSRWREALRAARQQLDSTSEEKDKAIDSLMAAKRDISVLLEKLGDIEGQADAGRRTAVEAGQLLERSRAFAASLEIKARHLEREKEQQSASLQRLAAAMELMREESLVNAEELASARLDAEDLREEKQRLENLIAEEQGRVRSLEGLAVTVEQLQAEVRCLRGDEEQLRLCDMPELMRYSAAITSALSKVNEAVLTARVADAHQQLSEASQCSICMSFPRDTALNCGHVICNGCSHRVSQCPICRAEISNRTRIFV